MARVFHITSYEDLMQFQLWGGATQEEIDQGQAYWATDLDVFLDVDIDMSNMPEFKGFCNLGTVAHMCNSFNGQGHTIKGMHYSGNGNWNLFQFADTRPGINTFKISNIIFEELCISCTGNCSLIDMGSIYYGIWYAEDVHITGYMKGNNVTALLSSYGWDGANKTCVKNVSRCSFSGSLIGVNSVSGLCAHTANGSVVESFVSTAFGTISGDSITFLNDTVNATVSNSFFIGNVTPTTSDHAAIRVSRQANTATTSFNYCYILNIADLCESSLQLFPNITSNINQCISVEDTDLTTKCTDVVVKPPSFMQNLDELRLAGWPV
jgi:hypothetical protein